VPHLHRSPRRFLQIHSPRSKKLVQELIERLLTEAANEANQKGWCDKATSDATQKRQYAADAIAGLNGNLAKLEALRDQLAMEIDNLSQEKKELSKEVAESRNERKEEKAENAATVTEASEGLDAVRGAIQLLSRFYGTQKNKADDAQVDDAYSGKGAEAGGVIAMMEVVEGDFERTVASTKKTEEESQTDHDEFLTSAAMSQAENEVANKEKTTLKDTTEQNIEDADENLGSQTAILKTSIKELLELKAACIDTGMSYADRVAMREGEIASLNKAMCILTAYSNYGPGGEDKC